MTEPKGSNEFPFGSLLLVFGNQGTNLKIYVIEQEALINRPVVSKGEEKRTSNNLENFLSLYNDLLFGVTLKIRRVKRSQGTVKRFHF